MVWVIGCEGTACGDGSSERLSTGEQQRFRRAYGIRRRRRLGRALSIAKVDAKRSTLFRLLVRAGIALTEESQARILACEDAEILDRWCENVIGAKKIAEVFG